MCLKQILFCPLLGQKQHLQLGILVLREILTLPLTEYTVTRISSPVVVCQVLVQRIY